MLIRQVTLDDSPLLLKWRNLPNVRKFMYTNHEITQEEHDRWFPSIIDNPKCKYFIYELDRPVGMACFTNINQEHGTADWAYYIGEETPKGSGQNLERLVLKCAFEELGLHKLNCEVLDFNEVAQHIHRKFGFTEEGRFREVYKKKHDVIRFGMTKAQYDIYNLDGWIEFKGDSCPVAEDVMVQLKLSNGNTPTRQAGVFTWSNKGRGTIYPHILAYRIVND